MALLVSVVVAVGVLKLSSNNTDSITGTVTYSDGSSEKITAATKEEVQAIADKRQLKIHMEADSRVTGISQQGLDNLIADEGHHDVAEHLTYIDKNGKQQREGFLTVGHGHRVKSGDTNPDTQQPWKEGDAVDPEWSKQELGIDSGAAFTAAKKQARAANDKSLSGDQEFMDALTNVNYQLGTNWTSKFPTAYEHIVKGRYEEAADEIAVTSSGMPSKWAIQTENRVQNFQEALRDLEK